MRQRWFVQSFGAPPCAGTLLSSEPVFSALLPQGLPLEGSWLSDKSQRSPAGDLDEEGVGPPMPGSSGGFAA